MRRSGRPSHSWSDPPQAANHPAVPAQESRRGGDLGLQAFAVIRRRAPQAVRKGHLAGGASVLEQPPHETRFAVDDMAQARRRRWAGLSQVLDERERQGVARQISRSRSQMRARLSQLCGLDQLIERIHARGDHGYTPSSRISTNSGAFASYVTPGSTCTSLTLLPSSTRRPLVPWFWIMTRTITGSSAGCLRFQNITNDAMASTSVSSASSTSSR